MMKTSILILSLFFLSLCSYGQVNYCDSIAIQISNQSLTSITCTTNTSGLNTFWNSQDWILTDKYGSTIASISGSTATFSMPSPMNSDTNYICLTSILSQPFMTISCNTCDTIVWDGTSWMLMSMMHPPCNLFGGSVYLDYSNSPIMMNASVNGMSSYNYVWNNGLTGVSQTQIYPGWCVTITDFVTGCDTTICENCIPDTLAVCPCPMIYMPVCGCDGIMYANDCIAICAGVGWTPAIPNGTLGGFLPCNQTSTCEVEIDGDSIICSWSSPQVLTAIPTGNGTPPYAYSWNNGQSNSNILTIINPGTYCVTITDANGCIATECITVSVQDIPIYSTPSPPIICLGDTVTLEFWNTPLTNIIWVPTGDSTHMIHDNPNSSTIYIVEGIDVNGCDRRGEVHVTVYQSTPLSPITVPNPPEVCVGDSVIIEVNQGFVNYEWNTGNPLDQGEDRVVIYPTQDFTYVVEALDSNGCESRDEILVLVDTCATGIHSEIFSQINIYPNPSLDKLYVDLPKNRIFTISVLSIEGKLILQEIEVVNSIVIDSEKLIKGSYILRIENNKETFNQIVIFE